jgi:serine/threonine-protein kinase
MTHVLDRSGEIIAERYKLISLIGDGGQAQVYRGVDLRDGDPIAVKVLADQAAGSPELRERMFREAHAMATLAGTAAVRVYHQGWTHDGALCLIMELLTGDTFDDYLSKREAKGERLSTDELITILEPVVDTLEKAHGIGILHRDIKPGNIFVQDDGSVRLLDFGLAKFVRMRGITQLGFIAGTPSYIAPEGWLGNPETLDQRIDVYSLGAVIYRALAGEPPFASKELKQLRRMVTSGERPSLHKKRPELDVVIDDWVRESLAIDPAERFFKVSAMWKAFKSIVLPPT